MDEHGRDDQSGAGPEDMMARRLSELGWLTRVQERAEAELDPSFAAKLRGSLVQETGDRPVT